MKPDNFKPNSNKYKAETKKTEERAKVGKVISGTAKIKKQNALQKFTDNFVSEDAHSIKSYIITDLVIPTVKNLLSNTVKDTIDMLLFGGTNRSRDRFSNSRVDYVSYSNYANRRGSARDTRDGYHSRSDLRYDRIVIPTKGEADKVLDMLYDILDHYGVVRVADLYEAVGLTGSHTDNKYGWTNLGNADSIRVSDGYILRLPKAMPID